MHRQSAIFSALFHIAVILIAFFWLPQFRRPLPALAPPIAIEVVTVADVTNPPKGRKDAPEEKKAEAEKPETRKTPAPAEEVKPKPVEKEPEKPKEQEEPKVAAVPKIPEKIPEKKEEPKPEPKATVEPTQPRVKTKPKPKPEPPKPVDMASVLKNVAKLKKEAPVAEKEQAAKPEPRGAQSNIANKPLSISELDAIRRQIERCWNVPAGAKDAQEMVVEIHVEMNPDRTVRDLNVVDKARLNTDTVYRTMAESAVRAVLRCGRDQPLKLPPDKYDTWRSFTLSFNPREMLGG
jgi:outer membrane biosynthesis protein TonB